MLDMPRSGALPYGWQRMMIVAFVELIGSACLLRARGRINFLNADLFQAQAMSALVDTDRDVVIDASEVTYLSTSGLAVFMYLWKELRKQNRDLHVCALRPYIRQVFEIIGFDKLIPLDEDLAAALAAVESGTQSSS